MTYSCSENSAIKIPEGFIVFISGVPGAGKTTISFELLKRCNEFRIIEETDLMREVLRGYNEYIRDKFGEDIQFLFESIEIHDHMKFLSFVHAQEQCWHMKKSFERIVARQQRKGIPSIINGVHIVPEVLDGIAGNHNVVFINLYLGSKDEIYNRFRERDPRKYSLSNMSLIYQTNVDLYASTQKLMQSRRYIFNNIDVTNRSIEDTVNGVINCIRRRIEHGN